MVLTSSVITWNLNLFLLPSGHRILHDGDLIIIYFHILIEINFHIFKNYLLSLTLTNVWGTATKCLPSYLNGFHLLCDQFETRIHLIVSSSGYQMLQNNNLIAV